jgi:hypothetical protein
MIASRALSVCFRFYWQAHSARRSENARSKWRNAARKASIVKAAAVARNRGPLDTEDENRHSLRALIRSKKDNDRPQEQTTKRCPTF